MAYIDSLYFVSATGPEMDPLSPRIADITRAGVDGHAFRADPYKSTPIQWTTTAWYPSYLQANAAIDLYASMKGSVVNVIDDMAKVSQCMIRDVKVIKKQNLLYSLPYGSFAMVRAVWTLQAV